MPSPSITFGFILATLIGAGFHLIFGGDARRLALFLLAGWFGFGVGQVVGMLFELDMFNVGTIRMLPAAVGAVGVLSITRLMTTDRRASRPKRG